MFTDSPIAKKFGCARIKTTQISNGAMMPGLQHGVIILNSMITKTFSRLYQNPAIQLNKWWASDTGIKKMNATSTLIFDVRTSKEVELKFYNMCPATGENPATAESLFQAVDSALKKDKLNWSKCVSFGVDNCNTNIGCNNFMKLEFWMKTIAVL